MGNRIHVGLLFGGRSCEHEVSVTSAQSVLAAIDRNKYDVTLVGIDKAGQWCLVDDTEALFARGWVDSAGLSPVTLDPQRRTLLIQVRDGYRPLDDRALDVVVPILHGPFGEDGTIQGLLELAGIPYVGAGVGGSAVGMDKEMMKRAFRAEGLPSVAYDVIRRSAWDADQTEVSDRINGALRYPLFIKPANLGSSVGVVRADGPNALPGAVEQALEFDYKVIVEEAVAPCREVECAVLGNEWPEASCLGEIRPGAEFYSYDAKYADASSELIIPAELDDATTAEIRALSLRAFRAVEACGLSRIDFFIGGPDNSIYLNEINTLPGFTPISMYPKLWAESGLPYAQLIDRLITLALERFAATRQVRSALE